MRRSILFALMAVPVFFAACGSNEDLPTAAPTPTPTVAPAPTPTPTPAAFVCPLPASSNPNLDCDEGGSQLAMQMNAALDTLMVTHPEIFNLNDLNGGSPKVINPAKYYDELVNELGRTYGICTLVMTEEISIKASNGYSEDWNVLTSAGYMRRRYKGTCAPAWF
jgi:hypothetical protein